MTEEREFFLKLNVDVAKILSALEVRYIIERNPVSKTRINHLLRRLYVVKEEINDALKEVWE